MREDRLSLAVVTPFEKLNHSSFMNNIAPYCTHETPEPEYFPPPLFYIDATSSVWRPALRTPPQSRKHPPPHSDLLPSFAGVLAPLSLHAGLSG